jgi:L-amino acid N-acyltransferase YncA
MSDSITIRPAGRDDLQAIQDIYNDAVLTLTASYDLEPQPIETRIAWFDHHQRDGLPVVVAERDGKVVGWGSLSRFRDRHGYRFTVENSIYIDTAHRGQGIGKLILASQIDASRALGMHALIAGIDSESAASRRLHASFGFEEIGHFKQVGNKFDRWLDVIFMELILV